MTTKENHRQPATTIGDQWQPLTTNDNHWQPQNIWSISARNCPQNIWSLSKNISSLFKNISSLFKNIYLGSLPRIISRTCLDSLVLFCVSSVKCISAAVTLVARARVPLSRASPILWSVFPLYNVLLLRACCSLYILCAILQTPLSSPPLLTSMHRVLVEDSHCALCTEQHTQWRW